MIRHRVAAGLICVLLVAACGGGSEGAGMGDAGTGDGHEHEQDGGGGMGAAEEFAFGAPGEATEADRSVEVGAVEGLRFEPSEIEARVGETIEIVFTNEDAQPHELVLGDAAYQEEHGSGTMQHDMEEPNATGQLPRGEGASIVWTFTEPGEVLFACHVEDHYGEGMVGTITVTE
ncbi:MAG: plastocyanin/azurin family copper-binding protein [Actinomycetota bacterium]